MSTKSVTRWIDPLKRGDHAAATAIWERFFAQLSHYAKEKLGPAARRAKDEEDIALSALNALYAGALEGRFQQLDNRHDIWQILMVIAARKASNERRRRHVHCEHGESDLAPDDQPFDLSQIFADGVSDAEAQSLNICCEELLGLLDDKLRNVALLRLSGHTNLEIAAQLGRGLSTVERYLHLIRRIWADAMAGEL